jgi:hypothetical protein
MDETAAARKPKCDDGDKICCMPVPPEVDDAGC